MLISFVVRFCLLLLMTIRCGTQEKSKPITCHGGTFATGQPAKVTCNLHAVNATEKIVNLVRYPPGASEYDPGTNIMVCSWKKETHRHHCKAESGYSFYPITRDSLTVIIPAVNEKHAGLYMCFIVPPDDTDSHACELVLNETPHSDTGSGQQTGISIYMWIAVAFAIACMVIYCVLMIFITNRHGRRRKGAIDDHVEGVQMYLFTRQTEESKAESAVDRIERLLDPFRLSPEHVQKIMEHLDNKIKADLENNTKETVFNCLPNGKERGEVLVVELSSRCLRVILMQMPPSNTEHESITYDIPTSVRMGSCTQLFEFIASLSSMFVSSLGRAKDKLDLAFVFSFPLTYDTAGCLTSARATRWTKGFRCDDVVGRKLQKLLENALRKQACSLQLKAIINDTVGVLVAGVSKDPMCKVSVMLGHGANCCFLYEKSNERFPNENVDGNKQVIINTDFGALGENGCLDEFITEFDKNVDKMSANPEEQIFEKMIGKLYLGEITRLVLLFLIKEGLLFKRFCIKLSAFHDKGGFSAEHVLLIHSDTSEECFTTKQVLQGLHVERCTDEDCKVVQKVCQLVVKRAASLAAAALATFIKHLDQSQVTVAVQGLLYECNTRFSELMQEKTLELIDRSGVTVEFISLPNGSLMGAALIVAML